MGNPWQEHIKKTQKENPSKSFKEVLVLAGKTYKKTGVAAPKKAAAPKKVTKSKKVRKVKKSKKSRKTRKTRKPRKSRK